MLEIILGIAIWLITGAIGAAMWNYSARKAFPTLFTKSKWPEIRQFQENSIKDHNYSLMILTVFGLGSFFMVLLFCYYTYREIGLSLKTTLDD